MEMQYYQWLVVNGKSVILYNNILIEELLTKMQRN